MNGAIISALAAHWRRNRLQLITLLAGLALGTGLWTGVQAINGEARASYDAAAATLGEILPDEFGRPSLGLRAPDGSPWVLQQAPQGWPAAP